MKPFVRAVLRLVECVALGIWIAVMPPALAGGIYEIITGGPSDTFLTFGMIFIIPWFVAVLAIVPAATWKVRTSRLICRWISIIILAGVIVIWCFQP